MLSYEIVQYSLYSVNYSKRNGPALPPGHCALGSGSELLTQDLLGVLACFDAGVDRPVVEVDVVLRELGGSPDQVDGHLLQLVDVDLADQRADQGPLDQHAAPVGAVRGADRALPPVLALLAVVQADRVREHLVEGLDVGREQGDDGRLVRVARDVLLRIGGAGEGECHSGNRRGRSELHLITPNRVTVWVRRCPISFIIILQYILVCQ